MRAWRPLLPHALVLAFALLLPACRGCRAGADARGDAGSTLAQGIPVNLDGKEIAPIDMALLARIPPDFTEGERRAWKLRTLLGEAAARPGLSVEIEDGEGQRKPFSQTGQSNDGREVVFAVNRLGEARIALIHPSEPFPSFHGHGERQGRAGDPARIREVRKIWLRPAEAPK
jgi:hypothetical protein